MVKRVTRNPRPKDLKPCIKCAWWLASVLGRAPAGECALGHRSEAMVDVGPRQSPARFCAHFREA